MTVSPRRRSRLVTVRAVAGTLFSALAFACIAAVIAAFAIGYRPVVITTGSMGDAAPVGSLVIAAPQAGSDIEVGDVIVMRRPGAAPITHRVIELDTGPTGIVAITQGDANPDPDSVPYAIGDEELVARWTVPGVGSALQSLRDPRLLLGTILVILVVATGVALRHIWSDGEPERRRGHRARRTDRRARRPVSTAPPTTSPGPPAGTHDPGTEPITARVPAPVPIGDGRTASAPVGDQATADRSDPSAEPGRPAGTTVTEAP